MANGGDQRSSEFVSLSWLQRPRVRLALRWSMLAIAALCAAVTALACVRPIIGERVGPFKISIHHPLKGVLLGIIALHVWALLIPPRLVAGWRFRISYWRAVLWVGALESGAIATLGVLATDLRWKWPGNISWINPVYMSSLSFVLVALALSKSDPVLQIRAAAKRCRIQWKQWNLAAKLVFVAFLVQAAVMGKLVARYWTQTSPIFLRDPGVRSTLLGANQQMLPSFNHFCEECRSKIPADARILYHGPNQGLIMAYELYPRRLFMLPPEQRAMFHDCWRNEAWCRGMAPDPLYAVWKWDPPIVDISESEFIAAHRITYVITYDEDHIANCRIQKL